MNAIQRALAESEASYTRCMKAVSASPERMFAGGATGITYTHSSLTEASEQYRHFRGPVFNAVSAISRRIAGLPVCVGKKSKKPSRSKAYEDIELIHGHEVANILADPSELQTQFGLLYSMAASILLTGRTTVWIDGNKLYYLPSHWTQPADNLRGEWIVRPDGNPDEIRVPGEDMIFAYMPDPGSPLGVSSALQASAAIVGVDEQIQNAQFRAFKNGIFPGLMIKLRDLADGSMAGAGPVSSVPILDSHQRDELVTALKRLYGGTAGYNQPLIVDGLIEGVEKLSLTPAEMDFVQSAEHIEQRIYRSFGINPIVLGQVEGANRASAFVAEESFCVNVVGPLAKLISDALTAWLGSKYGVEVFLEPPKAHDAELALKAWNSAAGYGYVTANEYRAEWLGLPPMDGGDKNLIPV